MESNDTGTNSFTIYVDNAGQRVFPCRCRRTHRGEYAFNDWAAHQCLHHADLIMMSPAEGNMTAGLRTWQVVCPQCGLSWAVFLPELPEGIHDF